MEEHETTSLTWALDGQCWERGDGDTRWSTEKMLDDQLEDYFSVLLL